MRYLKVLVLLSLLLFCPAARAQTTNLYFAQSTAGSGDGSSCANARAASTLNTMLNGGVVLHLCGSLTSSLTLSGGGAAGNHAVIAGDGTATTTGGFTVNGNFLTLQGIRYQGAGVFIGGGSMPHDIVIRNSWFRNDCNTSNGDLIGTEGSWNVTIEGNYMENCATSNDNHDDLVQTWAAGGNASRSPHDWTIRYNYFVMNTTATNNKSFHMLEGLSGAVNIYGNVYVNLRGADSANGVNMNSNQSSMVARIYGNTVVQKGGGNNLWNLKGSGSWDLRNNITYVTGVGNALLGDAVGTSRMTRQNNLWFGPGSPSCVATEICNTNPQFRNYAGDDFSLATSSPALGRGVTLTAPFTTAVLQGATWPSPNTGTRPAGTWDLGAFINAGGPPPPPPPPPPPVDLMISGSLPSGVVGSAYSANLSVTGGTPPYFCTVAGFLTGSDCPMGTVTITGVPVAAGTDSVTVTVRDTVNTTVTKTFAVTVNAIPPPPPPPTSEFYMYTEPAGPLAYAGVAGSTLQICKNIAIRDTSDGGPITVNLSASQPWVTMSPNTGGTRYQSNWCVNPSGLPAGTHSANVTLVAAGPNIAGEVVNNSPFSVPLTVTLTGPTVVSISINPVSATVQAGGAQQFTATVTGSTNTAVTWSATGGTIATLSANPSIGLFTAPVTAGSFTVTARSVADTTKAASAVVTVTVVPPPPTGQLNCTLTTQNNGAQVTSVRIECR